MSDRRRQRTSAVPSPKPGGQNGQSQETDEAPPVAATDEIRAIDSILQHRQPRPLDIPPATRGNLLARTGPVKDAMVLSDTERLMAYIDIYGKKPPEREALEEKIQLVSKEIWSMPEDETRSLVRATDRHPFLLASSPHIKMIMKNENYDPKRSAKRIARYWKQREAEFGDNAFTYGAMGTAEFFDYLQLYEKSIKTLFDPEEDEIQRALAQEYVLKVHQVKLDALDRTVDSTPQAQKADFMDAQERCPELAASDEHKLQFLSCEDFVEGAAARRMLRYWKTKYELFGPDKASRNITLDDLEDRGLTLEQGAVRLMPNTDEAGRPIIVIFIHLTKTRPTRCVSQSIWYIIQEAIEKHLCQARGVVVVLDSSVNIGLDDIVREKDKHGRNMLLYAAPFKMKAVHIRFNIASWWQRGFAFLSSDVGTIMFSRYILHFGTEEEMWRDFRAVGISTDLMPTELGGDVTLASWTNWVEERRRMGK